MNECKKLGAKTEIIYLRKYEIKPCKACYSTTNTQCHYPCSCYPKGTKEGDDMSNILYDKVLNADAIIFATPVNNFKVSSYMSLFVDRLISLDGSLSPLNPSAPKDVELNKKHTKFIELTANNQVNGSGFFRRFSGKVGGIITLTILIICAIMGMTLSQGKGNFTLKQHKILGALGVLLGIIHGLAVMLSYMGF